MIKRSTPGFSVIALIIAASVLCVGLIGLAVYFTVKSSNNDTANVPTDSSVASHLSQEKLSATLATWPPDTTYLASTINALNLPAAGPTILHHHVHLDLLINGEVVAVPANIGLSQAAESPLHTHDASGIVHVESANETFDAFLGNVFDVWNVALSSTQIGGYKNEGDATLKVYVNGSLYSGDPRQIALEDHAEIFIAYGTPAQLPASIPSSYTFPAEL
jgi:hypothetical protein